MTPSNLGYGGRSTTAQRTRPLYVTCVECQKCVRSPGRTLTLGSAHPPFKILKYFYTEWNTTTTKNFYVSFIDRRTRTVEGGTKINDGTRSR